MLGGEKSTPSMRRPVRVNLFFLFSFSFFILSASYFPFNQAASVAILPSARFVERFSLGASWALQSVLLRARNRIGSERLHPAMEWRCAVLDRKSCVYPAGGLADARGANKRQSATTRSLKMIFTQYSG